MQMIKPVKNESEVYTIVSFMVSDGWQSERTKTGITAAEKFAADEYRRFNVYKVKIYDSAGSLVKELV